MGVANIALTGGEPTLNKHLPEIVEFARSQKTELIEDENGSLVSKLVSPKIFLISNGGTMNKGILELCKQFDVHLSMSLPGLTTYNKHTGKGSADQVLHWFEEASKMDIPNTVNITVTRLNIHELYETISSALIAGAHFVLLNRFLPGGRGLKYAKELMLSVEQINTMLEITEEVLIKANRKGSIGTELPKCIIKNIDKYKNLNIGTRCSAGIDFFAIDPSGYIRACNHSPQRIIHFSELEKLKTHEQWKVFTLKQYHPLMCKSCNLLYSCDGGCREAAHICNGFIDSIDPVFDKKYK